MRRLDLVLAIELGASGLGVAIEEPTLVLDCPCREREDLR